MTLYCTECVAEWKLKQKQADRPTTSEQLAIGVSLGLIAPAVTLVTSPTAVPVGNGQAAMMPMMRLLCIEHIEVMSPTQQRLLGT